MQGRGGLAKGIPARLSSSNTERQALRHFGLIIGGIFVVLALWPVIFRGEPPRLWAAIPAAVLIGLGLAAPTSLRLFYQLWVRLGHTLGWINTCVLLIVVYLLVFTPIGLVMRLLGRDPLTRRLRDRSSYWIIRGPSPRGKRAMEFKF